MWPAGASAPAHLVEVAGADVEVASVTPSVIATRWVPHASLRPVATRPSTVSPAPGADGDSALRILVGHPLAPPVGGWAAVDALRGYVPASIAGVTWTEQPDDGGGSSGPAGAPSGNAPDRRFLRTATGAIRSAPDDAAPIRIALTTPRVIQVRAGAANDFLVVTVFLPFAEIDGFWKRPVPRTQTIDEEVEAEMSAETVQVHSPIAPGTCLYDAPRGRVVGLVRGADAFATPIASAVTGWYTATIPTIWGASTYYIDTPPRAPPSLDEGRWKESWTNEW